MEPKRIYTIELNNLKLGYVDRTLFEGANIGFGWGEFTALVGRNGAGKSTLLRTIAALSEPLQGEIIVDGRALKSMSASEIAALISFVSTDDVRVANLRVRDVVALGRTPYTNWIGSMTDEDMAIVDESLRLVSMSSYAAKSVDRLSDGERQRVMIARALAQQTPIILLDEPTAFLDLPNRYEICLLLRELAHKQGKTIIFSTHDLGIALELADAIAILESERFHYGTVTSLIESGAIDKLFEGTPLCFDRDAVRVKLRVRE